MPKRKGKGKSPSASQIKRPKIEHKTVTTTVSEYERKRIENIRKNNELLAQLNIAQAREDLSSFSLTRKPTIKPIRMKVEKVKEDLPRRQSLRIRKIEPDGITKLPDPVPSISTVVQQPRHRGKLEMNAANDVEEEDSKVFLDELAGLMSKDTKSITKKNIIIEKTFDSSRYSKLLVKENHVAKVVPQRVYSIQFHSIQSKALLFVGDKLGRLGIWDINSKKENNIIIYEPHTKPIINMAFDPEDQTKLVTASYDGIIRCADFSKEVFDEVLALDEDDFYFTYFGFGTPSCHTVLAASSDGQVRIVDCRKKGHSCPHYQLHDKAIKCLDVNPQRPNMFLTTTNKGQIAIWDIRNIKGPSSYLSIIERSRSISSAFFSPQTGQQILATGLDNFVTVNEVSLTGLISHPPSHMYRHDNFTGRWLATFHAKWDPKNEKYFAIGSMKYPRQLDVFSTERKGGPLIELWHENFTTITSRIAFHPTLNIIAGGNSSGKVFVWSE
ncbi:WD repeat-containing protein 76-like [Actinia tenebrosa]|uniref:WD repeat-containing protein 76 n=1 Tax=Actinia tenebrosa TaxID=6105 RepID=A0A6P8IMU3_ACTTE|nr:WD repeat-containing protein 76-like [Actinia tenebrosa]